MRYARPESITTLFKVSEHEKQQGMRAIVEGKQIIGNNLHKKFLEGIDELHGSWPPKWIDDVVRGLNVLYAIADELLEKNEVTSSCGSICTNFPVRISGVELECIVAHADVLRNNEFKDKALGRVGGYPNDYLSKTMECLFYEDETCLLKNAKPMICRLQNLEQDKTNEFVSLFDMFYHVIDSIATIDPSEIYGTIFEAFLINHYVISPHINHAQNYKTDSDLHTAIEKEMNENNIKRSWLDLNFYAHNYILDCDNDISRLYNVVEVKRNDKCPCGSGMKYKYCCM